MNDINNVVMTGRLTRDAQLAYAQSGTAITKFSIAVGYSVKNGDSWESKADFFDWTLFGKLGESVSAKMTKGKQITVIGRAKTDHWEKDGQKFSKVSFVADSLVLGSDGNKVQTNSISVTPENFPEDNLGDGSIPF